MLKKQLLILVALASVLQLLPVYAEQSPQAPQDKRWYVAPFGRLNKSGGNQDGDDGWGGGLSVGKIINKHFNVELKGFYEGFGHGFHATGGTMAPQALTPRRDLRGGTVDAQYYFSRSTFSPYTVVGLGGMQGGYPAGNGYDALFTAEAGAGFNYELNDRLSFRSDVRYRYGDNFSDKTGALNDMLVNVGFVVPIGQKPKAVQPPPMPIEVPVRAQAEPIIDCATLDSDGDGVNDCLDKCPGTLPGSKCKSDGCPISLELKGVLFEYDSAKLMPSSMSILDGVARNLITYPQDKDIEVQGHTSSEGSDNYNMKLSQKRSQSVVSYLKSKGVPNRLYAKGYGERSPVAENGTEIGRSQNRRVELVWLEH
ncbi:MAG: OmpA family protein [Methylococcaceae bacterium]